VGNLQAHLKRNRIELRKNGWKVITVWECELKYPKKVRKKLRKALTVKSVDHACEVIRYPFAEPTELLIAAEHKESYSTSKH
jgi:G:T-mismatch repair DNA endonuclease (very short patch repair protein)